MFLSAIKEQNVCVKNVNLISFIHLKVKSVLAVPSLYFKYSVSLCSSLDSCCLCCLMSFRSVSACEATVKKQYSLLGWKYRDTDSDDDDNITGCGKMQIIG